MNFDVPANEDDGLRKSCFVGLSTLQRVDQDEEVEPADVSFNIDKAKQLLDRPQNSKIINFRKQEDCTTSRLRPIWTVAFLASCTVSFILGRQSVPVVSTSVFYRRQVEPAPEKEPKPICGGGGIRESEYNTKKFSYATLCFEPRNPSNTVT